MQWSKLRTSVRALICPELRGRIDFHVSRYHARASGRSRIGQITIDGERILDLSYDRFCHDSDGWFAAAPHSAAVPGYYEWRWSPKQRDEIHPPQQLGEAMRAYLDMPIRVALKSPNPFIRSLALIDRRVGKRTLAELKIRECDHTLVKEFYALRMSALTADGDKKAAPQGPAPATLIDLA
jgi:hypothetical protein